MSGFGQEQFYAFSQEQSGRAPRSMPACLETTNATSFSASTNMNRKPAASQRYIPGLNTVNDPRVVNPLHDPDTGLQPIPKELVTAFLDGTKHPVSAIMEYGAIMKLVVTFHEAKVERPSIIAKFASVCKVNDLPFPQGVGKTKKDAKTAAAKLAFTSILGMDVEDVEDDAVRGCLVVDAHGREMRQASDAFSAPTAGASARIASVVDNMRDFTPKVALPSTASTPGLWEQPKHPVSRFQEYCQRMLIDYEFEVSNQRLEKGFRCQVFVCDQLVVEEYGLNKKEAKKKAAQVAIEVVIPDDKRDSDEEVYPNRPTPQVYFPPKPEASASPSAATVIPAASAAIQGPTPVMAADKMGPVDQLRTFCQRCKIAFELEVSANPGPEGYEATVEVNKEPIAYATGLTKKDARQKAATEALELLVTVHEPEDVPQEPLNHYDQMQSLAHQKLDQLLRPHGHDPGEHRAIAAFIIKRGEKHEGEVVAFGTGNTCTSSEKFTPDGRVMGDCHAMVIARRALLKYVHMELMRHHHGNAVHSIFDGLPGSKQVHLKDYITLHLYLSRPPCGDAAHFTTMMNRGITPMEQELMEQGFHYPTFDEDAHGFLRFKQAQGESTSPVTSTEQTVQTVEMLAEGEPLSTMSCSDKLLKWNVVGLQGALFSQFLEPLYLTSVTVGHMYEHGHMSRALCCRVSEELSEQLPHGFTVNHPYLGRVSTYDVTQECDMVSQLSINWSKADEKMEVLSTFNGRSVDWSPSRTGAAGSSRLCRAGFLHRFREMAKQLEMRQLMEMPNYYSCKKAALDYQQACAMLYHNLHVNNFGGWTRRPMDFQMFQK